MDQLEVKVREALAAGEDSRIPSIISRSKGKLQGMIGTILDYNDPVVEDLLINLCRYDYNNASEYFEENFAAPILRLQLQVASQELLPDA